VVRANETVRRFVSQARERMPGEILAKAFNEEPWKGQNPREVPVVRRIKPPFDYTGLSKGQNPGTEACWAGPSLRRWENRQVKR
jgi:hypothetical protein